MPRTGHCARHCRMIRTLKSSMTAATVADRRDGISQSAEYGRRLISAYDETGLPSFVQRRQRPGRVLLDGRHRFSIARSVWTASWPNRTRRHTEIDRYLNAIALELRRSDNGRCSNCAENGLVFSLHRPVGMGSA